MKAVSISSNLMRRLGFAGLLPSALLLMSITCSLARGGGEKDFLTLEPGLKGHPDSDPIETRKFFNNRVKFALFGSNVEGHFIKSQGDTIRIKVKPERTTNSRSWHGALLPSLGDGLIVARIENVDNQQALELGLEKNDKYAYIWIGELPLPSGKRGISFYTFKKDGSVLRKGSLELYSFTFCKDYDENKPTAEFGKHHPDNPSNPNDPKRCEDATRIAPTSTKPSARLTSYSPKAAASPWIGGLWISCSGGCCDVGEGAFY